MAKKSLVPATEAMAATDGRWSMGKVAWQEAVDVGDRAARLVTGVTGATEGMYRTMWRATVVTAA